MGCEERERLHREEVVMVKVRARYSGRVDLVQGQGLGRLSGGFAPDRYFSDRWNPVESEP